MDITNVLASAGAAIGCSGTAIWIKVVAARIEGLKERIAGLEYANSKLLAEADKISSARQACLERLEESEKRLDEARSLFDRMNRRRNIK